MIPLGKIILRDERSIAEARYKISLLAQALKFSSMDVTRLVTFTSKLGRNILESRKPSIKIGIEKKGKDCVLELAFHACTESLDTKRAENFFDDLKSHRTKEKFKDIQVFKLIPDPTFTLTKKFAARANKILNQRSREELFEELNKTNMVLKKERERATASRDYVENIIKTMVDSLIVVAPEALIQTVNQATCDMLGYRKEELIGKEVGLILEEDEGNEEEIRGNLNHHAFFQNLIKKGSVANLEKSLLTKKGRSIPVLFSCSAMRDGEGKIQGIVCVARDITERKEAEEKLRSAQSHAIISEKLAGIGQLSAGVCHEVLNPLNILSIYIQMLLMKRKQDAELQTGLGKMMNEVKRIDKIVRTLMTFARKKDMEAKGVQVGAELESALSLFEKDFQTDNVAIAKEIDAELPELWVDADELRQVILNIINNAKYAMREGGVLTVSAKRWAKNGSSFVRLKFSDTGTGIKKEHLDKIFDPFFTTKPEGEGTGMGLSVAHTIIAKHGGTIQVESKEGHGTAFIIDLPIK